jgi:hypothetical protein
MQLERLWFESFDSKAAAQQSDSRSAAVRDASRRLMRAVKRRVDPTLSQRRADTSVALPPVPAAPPTKPVDANLQTDADAAERAVQELTERTLALRADVLARVRHRADAKLRLLYSAPTLQRSSAALSDALAVTAVKPTAALVSVRSDALTPGGIIRRKKLTVTTGLVAAERARRLHQIGSGAQ